MPKPAAGTNVDTGLPLGDMAAGWIFAEGAGTTFDDCAGTLNGTLDSATWDAAGIAVDASFNSNAGQSAYVPANSLFGSKTASFSVAMRVRLSNIPFDQQTWLFAASRVNSNDGWALGQKDGSPGFVSYGIQAAFGTATPFVVNTWVDIVFSVQADNSIKVYADATMVDTLTCAAPATNTNDVWRIGSGTGNADPTLSDKATAKFEYLYVYDRALSGSEAASLHADPYSMFASGDTTPPNLSSPTGTATGTTTATVGATTDEGNGTLYAVVTTSGTAPTATQVKTGKDNAGATAAYAGSLAITSTGAKTLNATGLTASTTYYAHLMHEDAAGNPSTVVSSASFTTDAPALDAPVLTDPVTVTGTTVDLDWTAVAGATGYTVRYDTDPGFSNPVFVDVPDGATTTDEIASLEAGTTYYFAVRAYDGSGTSAWSNTASGTIPLGVSGSASITLTATATLTRRKAVVGTAAIAMTARWSYVPPGRRSLRITSVTTNP